MPFEAEKARIDKAEFGLQELREVVDTVIVLDNNRLVDIAGQLPMEQAFAVANELVSTMIKGISRNNYTTFVNQFRLCRRFFNYRKTAT